MRVSSIYLDVITKIEDKPNIFPVPDLSHDVSRDVHVREKKKIYKKKSKRQTFVEEDAEYWVKGVLVIVRGTGNETNRCRTVDVKNEKMIVRKF